VAIKLAVSQELSLACLERVKGYYAFATDIYTGAQIFVHACERAQLIPVPTIFQIPVVVLQDSTPARRLPKEGTIIRYLGVDVERPLQRAAVWVTHEEWLVCIEENRLAEVYLHGIVDSIDNRESSLARMREEFIAR
jgi:hypothetical protein